MDLFFSLVIPVYNRPDEIRELLDSLVLQTYTEPYEIVIVEDGSQQTSEDVVALFEEQLNITYLFKPNSGPGDSRNYGMRNAKGNYFIVLDSDCLLPPQYLTTVYNALTANYVDCFGGPDAAHKSFSKVQKAINYAMTSFISTGGIRGKASSINKFQPRSFNMGISKKAFESTGGYGKIHPGEDPDLSIRLWNKGFKTALIREAFVYHKRRVDFNKFYIQVNKFGMVRPILNSWHPSTARITYWFPSFFCAGLALSLLLLLLGFKWLAYGYMVYGILVFVDALIKNKDLSIAFLALISVLIQFIGYGYG
ncbi:MAG: glycosyltransferase, partial [Eudoraea sp.]|nr:glycosyltransferase [Eudoraea sp.]